MDAAKVFDAIRLLEKSQISPKFHKRFAERLNYEEGAPSLEDQVKALEAEFLDITGQTPGKDQDSESKLDSEMKEYLGEKFPQDPNQESESD